MGVHEEIADVLAFVNRQMILILKTILLRNIKALPRHQQQHVHLHQMSKSCLKTIEERRLRDHAGGSGGSRIRHGAPLEPFKISCYRLYLQQVYWSRLGSVLYLR